MFFSYIYLHYLLPPKIFLSWAKITTCFLTFFGEKNLYLYSITLEKGSMSTSWRDKFLFYGILLIHKFVVHLMSRPLNTIFKLQFNFWILIIKLKKFKSLQPWGVRRHSTYQRKRLDDDYLPMMGLFAISWSNTLKFFNLFRTSKIPHIKMWNTILPYASKAWGIQWSSHPHT